MSLSNSRCMSTYQPFQCLICHSRFTRHENLKRHAALHSRSQDEASLPCNLCHATFSRSDLRRRHMKKKHPGQEQLHTRQTQRSPRVTVPRQDDVGSSSPIDSEESPLQNSSDHWEQLEPGDETRSARQLHTQTQGATSASIRDGQMLHDATVLEKTLLDTFPFSPNTLNYQSPGEVDGFTPTALQITHGCDLFFTHIAHFVPFIHQPTFDLTQAPQSLLLSMLSLAYHHGADPEDPATSISSTSPALSERCFHHARVLAVSTEESDPLTTVQCYLLLQICAMMYLCGEVSSHGLKMHSSMISLARTHDLMHPEPISPTPPEDLSSLWQQYIRAETRKRTSFAVHQVDALWYQFLSIPRSISHLEIKHDLPSRSEDWVAPSAASWAHRQLISRPNTANSTVQYADAIRLFLSPDADLQSLPPFDPYGAINIAQFLISSAREISGWSAMTGMLSMDRFGALRASLVALAPYITSSTPSSILSPHFVSPHSMQHILSTSTEAGIGTKEEVTAIATYQTAMIELHLWSPSHTGGIVSTEIDQVLRQLTTLAAEGRFLCDTAIAEAVQPHVTWFLKYLNTTQTAVDEAPWVAVYAYKAFLIAWQFVVRGALPDVMGVVGVGDGDGVGAVLWAKNVFARRKEGGIRRVVMECLDLIC